MVEIVEVRVKKTRYKRLDVLLSCRGIITIGLCVLNLCLFYKFSWMNIQVVFAKTIKLLLLFSKYEISRFGNYLIIDEHCYIIGSLCTYMNWVVASIPLLWRQGCFLSNARRVFGFIILIFCINTIRIYMAIVLHIQGYSWLYCHTIITHLLSWTILCWVFFLWYNYLRSKHPPVKTGGIEIGANHYE